MRSRPAEVALSAGVLALGLGAAAVTATLPSEGGYAGIGPNFFPALVSGGLVLLGVWLGVEAFSGGWRNRSPSPDVFVPRPFLWVSAGLFAHMALIGWGGFVVAGTILFACVARAFGSRRLVRDLVVALLLTHAIYFFFVKLLNVSLPAGWMQLLH
jgi:putative tricarboxylic transport membrane protein